MVVTEAYISEKVSFRIEKSKEQKCLSEALCMLFPLLYAEDL